MKTHPSCLSCFARQADYAAQLATIDTTLRSEISDEVQRYLAGLNMESSPPENAIGLYALIAQLSGNRDPFAQLKRQSNSVAMNLRPHIEAAIRQCQDPLYRSIQFAIAGNIIDYGAQQSFDLDATLQNCIKNQPGAGHYQELRRDLGQARQILYLADNCGELVFDGLLIEQLQGTVTVAVKDGPIINDATMDDALFCGIDKPCRVISNGTVCPGTPLSRCNRELRRLFREADVVISKGQGNFETLSEEERPVYHLLTVKCPVVADRIKELSGISDQLPIGTAVLLKLGHT